MMMHAKAGSFGTGRDASCVGSFAGSAGEASEYLYYTRSTDPFVFGFFRRLPLFLLCVLDTSRMDISLKILSWEPGSGAGHPESFHTQRRQPPTGEFFDVNARRRQPKCTHPRSLNVGTLIHPPHGRRLSEGQMHPPQ